MLEDLADGLSLVISAVCSLSNLLEDNIFDLGETLGVDGHSSAFKTPRLQDDGDEVVLLVDWGDGVTISVVAAEVLLRDVATLASLAHDLNEIVHHGLSTLLAGGDSGVSGGVVLRDECFEGDAWGTLGELLPCLLDDGKAICAHVSLEDVDELVVGDVTVLVLIEVIEDDAKLLFCEEDTQLGHELFELQLLQDSVLVAIKAHEDVIELIHIVNALSEQLALHLVGDLVHTVSPVGHNAFFFLFSLSE